jgi:hypothetical protein
MDCVAPAVPGGFGTPMYLTKGLQMPNARTHKTVGTCAGILGSVPVAGKQCDFLGALVALIGGGLGGYVGGITPDLIDKPTSPNHRATAHGVLPVALAAGIGSRIIKPITDALLRWAEAAKKAAAGAGNPVDQALYSLARVVYLVAAGFVAGFAVGYLSHVVLDLTTKRGLPVA